METLNLANSDVLRSADVSQARESHRQKRLKRLYVVGGVVLAAVALHYAGAYGWPDVHVPGWLPKFAPAIVLLVVLLIGVLAPIVGAGRSPHVLFRPEQIGIGLRDVKGASVVVEEVVKTLNLFLAYKTFKEHMGGTPRRAILFEGPPGTGKTYIAKAMAAEANVPFLFVSSTAFQSHFYGVTGRKIRSFFKDLRKYARREGGAIGFIEEIDAIGAARSGVGGSGEGIAGVVNELLIQLQSFDEPPMGIRVKGFFIDVVNRWLPASHTIKKPLCPPANILVIGATNRAGDLDPALLRPGRFDRTITVDLPSRSDRREIIDYYLARKKHAPELDSTENRDTLAATTMGYSPVMIEHLLDEALVWALRRGSVRLSWEDLQRAKMTTELGLAQPTAYSDRERVTIATHEAGHAVTAWLVTPERKLEVLSIVKRSVALGLLAHSEPEERYTRTKSEVEGLIRIAMGGLVAEELFFGDTSSGVAGDLQAATEAAAQMVGSFGMAGSLVSLDAAKGGGHVNIVAKVLSDDSSRQQLEAVLDSAREEVRALMAAHAHLVEALRDALLEREELIGVEITDVLTAAAARYAAGVLDLRDPLAPGPEDDAADSGQPHLVEDERLNPGLVSPRVISPGRPPVPGSELGPQ
ncbi:MAG TPA: AAA family ATPase [Acidimicrobiales bacterium]|nr:AAA family ATPase [Acidimicrobiales bacterium]